VSRMLTRGSWSRRLLAWILALVFLAFGVFCNQTTLARKVIGPPTLEQVATTWVGLSEDELYFFRIVLDLESMSGRIGYIFAEDEACVFDISAWTYESGVIEIDAQFPPGSESWEGLLRGSVNPQGMKLKMSGRHWSRFLHLRQEGKIENSWRALKKEMERGPQANY